MADNNKTTQQTKREMALQRLKAKNPESNFEDDEAIFGQVNDDYDNYEKQIEDYKGREKAFSDLFSSDLRAAQFLTDWRQGQDPTVSLIRKFGPEFKEALDDPEKQEALAQANKEYAEQVAKEKGFVEEYMKNIDETISHIDKLEADGTYPKETIDKAMELLLLIVAEGSRGKFSPETIDMAVKAVNHDIDVNNANEDGVVKGRNDKYEERLRKEKKGDGTPALAGKNGTQKQNTDKQPNLGALGNFGGGSQNIWERGGEKRIKQ